MSSECGFRHGQIMEIRYNVEKCHCPYFKQAGIEVVGPNKLTAGKLYSVCKTRACKYWKWLLPESITYSACNEETSNPFSADHDRCDTSDESRVDITAICEELTLLKHEVVETRREAKEMRIDIGLIKSTFTEDGRAVKQMFATVGSMKKLIVLLLLLQIYVLFFK